MTSRPPLIRLVLVLLCLTLVACSGKTTPTAAGSGTASASAKPGTVSSRAPSPEATTATTGSPKGATAGKQAAPPKKASQSTPPAPGTYTYRQRGTRTVNGKQEHYPDEGTLLVKSAERVDGGWRSEHTRDTGEEQSAELVYLFASDGVYLQQLSGAGVTCVIRPPLRVVPIPLKVGATWKDTSACTTNGQTLEMKVSGKVLRTEQRTVGSRSIKTFVLDIESNISVGTFTQNEDSTVWLSPDYRIPVRKEAHRVDASPVGSVTSDYTEQLVSITPKT